MNLDTLSLKRGDRAVIQMFTRLQVLKGSLGKVVLMHARVPPERSQGEKPQLPNQRGSSVINTTMNDRPDGRTAKFVLHFEERRGERGGETSQNRRQDTRREHRTHTRAIH